MQRRFLRLRDGDSGLGGREVCGRRRGVIELALCEEELVYRVLCHVSARHLITVGQGSSLPWIARSSGRLSRTRLRVRFPQSLAFTRCALVKSQPFVFRVESVSISKSIDVFAPCGKCVGDCASGVERVPKLEFDAGEASSKCLRLVPISFEIICGSEYIYLSYDTKCVLLRRWEREGCRVVNRDE